ncbi:D-2-hydroxyacid dehydrogenase [Candidatus Woesearchaeota archaeon]|nr:D-2-hydroxyacid dehydrogenase [Candidatus Woesearchaeota archaeon]
MKIIVVSNYLKYIKRYLEQNIPKDCDVFYFEKEEEAIEDITDAEILFCHEASEEFLKKGKNLKWVHTPWAGVEKLVYKIPENIIFTRTIEINDIDIARYVSAYVLYFSQEIKELKNYQKKKEWALNVYKFDDLKNKSVGVFGLGSIGRKIAESLLNLGFEVYGFKKHKTNKRYEFIKEIFYEKNKLIKISDYIVLALPLTGETKDFISKNELNIMKKNTILINIGRGPLINENDLIDALKNKKIRAAVLDVFCKEPLPKNSELWELDNILITPHISGLFRFKERVDFFIENLHRFIERKPLIGAVDLKKGY